MQAERIILGTVQFGLDYGINNSQGKPDKDSIFHILDTAYANGIRILDTAEAYGNSIDILADYHQTTSNRFEIISKIHFQPETDIETTVRNSLSKLGINQFYAYLFHSFNDLKKYPLMIGELLALKELGLVNYLGVSVYDNSELSEAISMPFIDLIQLPYNLLDNQNQRGELLKKAKNSGKIIHTRSVFLQGLFFKEIDKVEKDPILSNLTPYLIRLKEIALKYNLDMQDLALQYALNNDCIDGVLLGVDTLQQLEININSLNSELNSSVFSEINDIKVDNPNLLYPIHWK